MPEYVSTGIRNPTGEHEVHADRYPVWPGRQRRSRMAPPQRPPRGPAYYFAKTSTAAPIGSPRLPPA